MKIIKKFWAMPHRAAAFMSALALISSPSAYSSDSASAPRIASTSLCGDAYLLGLAPDQAMALSWQSRGPLSRAEKQQKALPQAWDDAERLIALNPDLVLFGPGEGYSAAHILDKAGIDYIRLDWAEDIAGILDNYAKLGVIYVPSLRAPYTSKPKMLYLSRSGGSAGTGTFVDSIITAAGGVNVMTRKGWFTPDAEALAFADPDIIILSYMNQGFESAQAKVLTNGVHKRLIDNTQTVEVPGKLWPCAGPGYFEALEIIRGAASDWRAAQGPL